MLIAHHETLVRRTAAAALRAGTDPLTALRQAEGQAAVRLSSLRRAAVLADLVADLGGGVGALMPTSRRGGPGPALVSASPGSTELPGAALAGAYLLPLPPAPTPAPGSQAPAPALSSWLATRGARLRFQPVATPGLARTGRCEVRLEPEAVRSSPQNGPLPLRALGATPAEAVRHLVHLLQAGPFQLGEGTHDMGAIDPARWQGRTPHPTPVRPLRAT